jgi:hypothetical protein
MRDRTYFLEVNEKELDLLAKSFFLPKYIYANPRVVNMQAVPKSVTDERERQSHMMFATAMMDLLKEHLEVDRLSEKIANQLEKHETVSNC